MKTRAARLEEEQNATGKVPPGIFTRTFDVMQEPWTSPLQETLNIQHALVQRFPGLRKTPSPAAWLFKLIVLVALLVHMPKAFPGLPAARDPTTTGSPLFLFRTLVGLYSAAVLGAYMRQGKQWALTTFTIWTWILLILRLLLSASAALLPGGASLLASFAADSLRFAVVNQACIVVFVWWGAMVPLFLIFSEIPRESREDFLRFNLTSLFFVNFHGLVLPFALVDWTMTGGGHSDWELWVQVFIAFCYLILYATWCDKRGWYHYVLFTPRSHWCAISYTLMFGLISANFHLFNACAPKRVQ